METVLLCTFTVDDLNFGIDVRRIQEVIRFQDLTPVPLAHKTISGLINLRGEIVTAIDLRSRLEVMAQRDERPMNVVVAQDEGVVSYLVDKIGDVVEVNVDELEPVPETVTQNIRALVEGVCKLDGRLLLVLDTDQVSNIH